MPAARCLLVSPLYADTGWHSRPHGQGACAQACVSITIMACPDHFLNSACTDFTLLPKTSASAFSCCHCTADPIPTPAWILTTLLSMYLYVFQIAVSDLAWMTLLFLHMLPSNPLQAPTCYQAIPVHCLLADQPAPASHLPIINQCLLITCLLPAGTVPACRHPASLFCCGLLSAFYATYPLYQWPWVRGVW